MVVEGGLDQTIGDTIYAKKTIGCFTNGTTSVTVIDPVTGYSQTISFFRPTYTEIYALVTLTGYGSTPNSATLAAVQAVLVAYLNGLSIGETVSIAALIYEAMSVNPNLSAPAFGAGIRIGVATASTTATFGNAVSTIVVASASGIISGQLVTGTGIAPGTLVSGAPSGTSVPISIPTTSAETASPVVFSTLAASDIAMANYNYVAQTTAGDVSVVT